MRENRKKKKVSVKPVKSVKPRRGRKTKLTPELKDDIIKYIEAGNYIKHACQLVGISEQTYYTWIKRGEAGEDQFLEFLESIKKAGAKAIARNVLIIQAAAKKSWQAAA